MPSRVPHVDDFVHHRLHDLHERVFVDILDFQHDLPLIRSLVIDLAHAQANDIAADIKYGVAALRGSDGTERWTRNVTVTLRTHPSCTLEVSTNSPDPSLRYRRLA